MDMERGPRYEAYAELREKKLRMKYLRQQEDEEKEEPEVVEPKLPPTPPRKQVKFQGGFASGRKGSSVLAQSVPDFSAALRKENRKPVNMLPTVMELTPPSKSFSKGCGVLSSSRGSKSANAGEKRRGGGGGGGVLMARKSYASIDELKSFSSVTANAINGESRIAGGRNSSRIMGRKTVLGCRQI
ncbi:uncharacterized protein LOC133292661 [Gastrolobium bilobum]|uniref:uncharacterized protein LOC133292661 n=1 Tax=Gastrolobium bilobum TaxID=150636 RepID=UPI002AAF8247|nr:uncharacterized protein LOC133292661 [Gastrolobium bilobum]